MNQKRFDKKILNFGFYCLCLIIIINPIPFASNRDWAWGSLGLISLLLLFLLSFNDSIQKRFHKIYTAFKLEMHIILAWLLIHLLYLIPLPVSVLNILSPAVSEAYQSLNFDYGFLTLDVYGSFKNFLLSCYFFAVFLLCLLLINSRKKTVVIILILMILGVFEVLYGTYLISINRNGLFFDLRTVATSHLAGTYINKNHMVAFLSICFYWALSYRLYLNKKFNEKYPIRSKRWLKKLSSPMSLIDVCLFVLIGGIWATHSKAGLFSFFIGLGFLLFLYFQQFNQSLFSVKSFLIGLIFLVLIVLFSSNDIDVILKNLGFYSANTLEQIADVAYGRKLAIEQFLQNWDKFWLFGLGPGAYEVFFVNHRVLEQMAYFDHAHNDYIEFIIEFGLFSLLLIVLLLAALKRAAKILTVSISRFYKLISAATICTVVYFLTHGLFDFNARIPANVVILIVSISLSYTQFLSNSMQKINN